jgi:hypothetical protein
VAGQAGRLALLRGPLPPQVRSCKVRSVQYAALACSSQCSCWACGWCCGRTSRAAGAASRTSAPTGEKLASLQCEVCGSNVKLTVQLLGLRWCLPCHSVHRVSYSF